MTSRTGVPAQTRVPSAAQPGVTPVTRVPTGSRTGLANPAQRTVPGTATVSPVARVPSGATGQPVTRQPSGMAAGLGTNQPPTSALASRTRAPTGNSAEVQSQAAVAQTRVAQSTVTPRGPSGAVPQRQPTGGGLQAAGGTDGSITPRTAGASVAASRAVQRARRVSKVIVEKEKKTDYWQEIIQEARLQSPDLSQDDVNAMVARCLSLDLVSNWKAREEQGTAPKASELFQQLEISMERKLNELNGAPVRVAGTGFKKIKEMERQLQILETRADKAQEDEAEKVKAKITELSKTLANVQQKKEAEREQNRRTMTIEINNLREQMQKAASEPSTGDSAKLIEENKKMAQKMARLEAALRQMNEERKKGVDDNDTAMLKKKLTLFETRMKQLEEEKKLKESEEHTDTMRDKLLLMEEKLAKMERRKSVSITMMMQQKMQQVEEELARLRSTGGGGSQVADLEKKLVEMQNTKVNPSMINDPETRALRSHIKKMEDAMLAAEKKMEADRLRLEEEREQQVIKRQREEEAYRKKAQQREQLLLEKMAEMEKRIASASRGGPPPPPGARGGGGPGMDQALQKKMEELEAKMSGGAFAEQMAAMEKRIKETEERLAKERQTTSLLQNILYKDGTDDPAMKDAQIANLTQTTQELMAKLEATAKAMDERFNAVTTKIETMAFSGPAVHVHKSGLSYADINAKLEEIQKKLFDPDIEERESEQLNIEYEKLISELEGTAEYKAEQEAAAKKWKEENIPLNNAALAKLKQEIGSWTPMKKTAQFKRKPELKFLEFTPDQINKKHVNDFKGVTTQNLTLEEARALFACMPEFRKDQEAQLQFVEQLKNKIEVDSKKPAVKAPPPIKATKQVVFKKPPAGGDGGSPDFLAELMKKRKPVG